MTLLLFGDVQIENASVSFAPSNTQGLTPEAVATPESMAEYNPMQAFFVKTGLTQPACAEAPADGILIQTPQDAAQKVILMINGAEVQFGSTVYVEAYGGDEMEISTLEGAATITAFGHSETAVTGMKIGVLIDDHLRASGPPTAHETADFGLLLALPVQALPEPIFSA